MSNDKSHSVLGVGSLAQGHCIPLARMEAASQYPFLVYLRLASYQAFQAQRMQPLSLPSQRLYRDSLSFLVIEEVKAATTGCGNGLCEKIQPQNHKQNNQRGQEVGAAGMPDFYHIQRTMQCNSPHLDLDPSELDPSWSTIRKLSSGVIPANNPL